MEFACQGDTEACFSENFVDFVDHSSAKQVKADKIKTYSKNQVRIIDCKPQKKTDGEAISTLASELNSQLAIQKFCSSEAPLRPDNIPVIYQRSITDLPPALISEIFNCLDPKELGVVSCVSLALQGYASDHPGWKQFYCERWGLPTVPKLPGTEVSDERSWRDLFVEREFRSKTFLGRYSIDTLYGHTESVRTVFLLVSAKLMFTSGYDSIVRMWNIEEAMSIASSRPLGCTIRAVAADTKLLVAGGTDGFIHCWRAVEGLSQLFDLNDENTEFRLWEHGGPITSLALKFSCIFSGSWDMTVRVWDRASLKCLHVLRHNDWIWDLVPHDTTVVSSSGSDVYVWDINTGTLQAVIQNAHSGHAYALARSHTGNLLFTGGEDGAIRMFDIAGCSTEEKILSIASWIPHTGAVHSLAFEFPWLVSASSDGKLSLIDARKLVRTAHLSSTKHISRVERCRSNSIEPPQRMLHGPGCSLFSVGIGADRIVCGGEEGALRVWNFSQALEVEQRARSLRGMRLENRMRRRKLQMEMNAKVGRNEQCSVAAKKNLMNGQNNKRAATGKVKA